MKISVLIELKQRAVLIGLAFTDVPIAYPRWHGFRESEGLQVFERKRRFNLFQPSKRSPSGY